MKMKLFVFMVGLVLTLLVLPSCAKEEDFKGEYKTGGFEDRSWADAPKVIKSKTIEHFECEFVCNNEMNVDYGYCFLEMERGEDAALGRVLAITRWDEEHDYSFQAPLTLLDDLQALVDQHDLARANGTDRHTNGLPPNEGSKVKVLYQSGESIRAYDNAGSVLGNQAELALFNFFQDQLDQAGEGASSPDQD